LFAIPKCTLSSLSAPQIVRYRVEDNSCVNESVRRNTDGNDDDDIDQCHENDALLLDRRQNASKQANTQVKQQT
jgi:hypothetical protein